eukprot:7989977-Prorocentrum_lima.AAC.1
MPASPILFPPRYSFSSEEALDKPFEKAIMPASPIWLSDSCKNCNGALDKTFDKAITPASPNLFLL